MTRNKITGNDHRPGAGFLGWLGRQVGHIGKAIKTDVTATTAANPRAPQVIFEDQRVEEQPHPQQSGVMLRRTVTDQVILHPPQPATTKPTADDQHP